MVRNSACSRSSPARFGMLRTLTPGKSPDRIFARSVAKRAVGTISSQWVELLAADAKADLSSGERRDKHASRRRRRTPAGSDGEGPVSVGRAGPFTTLCKRLGKMLWPLRKAGDHEGADAVLAAIKALAPMVRRERGKSPSPSTPSEKEPTHGL